MKTLLLAATPLEIAPTLSRFGVRVANIGIMDLSPELDCLIGGIGLAQTTFHLTKALVHSKYSQVIQVGIAGSYHTYKKGDVVEVTSEQYGDLGAENANGELIIFEELQLDPTFSFDNLGRLNNKSQTDLPNVHGISVNLTAGQESTIEQRMQNFKPAIESMEGLALFMVCKQLGIPFLEVRAISNKVEARNKNNWDNELAIGNLNKWLFNWLKL